MASSMDAQGYFAISLAADYTMTAIAKAGGGAGVLLPAPK